MYMSVAVARTNAHTPASRTLDSQLSTLNSGGLDGHTLTDAVRRYGGGEK